jgi:two-component system response regulator MprA
MSVAGSGLSAEPEVCVLMVEDDPRVRDAVRAALETEGFQFQHAGSLVEARRLMAFHRYHAMILDLVLPDGTGLDLARELREQGSDIPILMLTARHGLDDRLAGFGLGADDYVCKPFEVPELLARLNAVLRRSQARERAQLRYADVELDLPTLTARRGDIQVTLSAREFELLAFLMRHPEEALSRERLLHEVWGETAEEDSNVVNVYINYLRNKLEQGREGRLIHTVRGVGYMLSESDPDDSV